MLHSNPFFFLLISICILIVASCSTSQEKQAAESGTKEKVDPGKYVHSGNELEGVLYPQAVITFKTGLLANTEGLHFEKSKREKGHLTHDVDGAKYVLSWKYIGSDEDSDNYQISLEMPADQQPSQNRELQYSGERSVTFYKTDQVSVIIEESMDTSSEDQP